MGKMGKMEQKEKTGKMEQTGKKVERKDPKGKEKKNLNKSTVIATKNRFERFFYAKIS